MSYRSERKPEVDAKLSRLRSMMQAHNVDVLILRQTANIAWVTAGANTFINQASDYSPVYIAVTADKAYAVTDRIEAPRLRQEEAFDAVGFEIVAGSWYADGGFDPAPGKNAAQDGSGAGRDVSREVQTLRMTLVPEEIERARIAGRLAGEAMNKAARATRPGDPEYTLAARLAAAAYTRGGQPTVVLIASDDRIFQFRHPLPTAKKVEKYAMLVLCLRYEGLIISVTRLVHFGPLSDELRTKTAAVARVDAQMILGTQPGRTMGDMFDLTRKTYADEGYAEAIEEHHQGGSAAYAPREVFARPGDPTVIAPNQMFAWNPSIRGVKSEDTVLLTERGIEVLTVIDGWPTTTIKVGDASIARPVILEV